METSTRSEILENIDQETNDKFRVVTEMVPNRIINEDGTEVEVFTPVQRMIARPKTLIQEAMNIQDASGIMGWDNDANKTIKNWFMLFKEYRYRYQFIYDRNMRRASILSVLSAISSTILGILSAFKLWQDENSTFRVVSDITLMIFNFTIAVIIAISKRLLDDVKNEKIRKYIEEVDKFLGVISAQALKSPIYRMDAKMFFDENNSIYTKLFTDAPNLSLKELQLAKSKYAIYQRRLERPPSSNSLYNDERKNEN
jgi:hypothetical protein